MYIVNYYPNIKITETVQINDIKNKELFINKNTIACFKFKEYKKFTYSKIAIHEMEMLSKANMPYPKNIPDNWKEYKY